MKSFTEISNNHILFTIPLFTTATAISSLHKCRGEMDELESDLINQSPGALEEYADCFLCLIDSAARAGFSPWDLLKAMDAKVEKNKGREWIDNGNGTYSHKKSIKAE